MLDGIDDVFHRAPNVCNGRLFLLSSNNDKVPVVACLCRVGGGNSSATMSSTPLPPTRPMEPLTELCFSSNCKETCARFLDIPLKRGNKSRETKMDPTTGTCTSLATGGPSVSVVHYHSSYTTCHCCSSNVVTCLQGRSINDLGGYSQHGMNVKDTKKCQNNAGNHNRLS